MRDAISPRTLSPARAMRRAPTDAERALWGMLRHRRLQTVKFRRQAPLGPYIVDFLCVAHKLVIEADGSQHVDSSHDARRDDWLRREGYKILRFFNVDVLRERENVLAAIAAACGLPW